MARLKLKVLEANQMHVVGQLCFRKNSRSVVHPSLGFKLLLVALVMAAGCGGGDGVKCKYHDQFGKQLCHAMGGGSSEVGAYRYYAPPPRHPMSSRRMR